VTTREPRWLERLAVDEAHFRQVREHGGRFGIRDENALEAALARPRHRWTYEVDVDLADLAAAYAFGLVRGHPYVDGNKRSSLIAMVAFLDLSGVELMATDVEAVTTMLAAAAGDLSEPGLADWIRSHMGVPRSGS
jgi:death-on-curing protein